MVTTDAEIDQAFERAKAHDNDPLAETVKYVPDLNLLIIGLNTGQRLVLPLEDEPELGKLTKKQFENWELLGPGIAINFPDVDVALAVDGMKASMVCGAGWLEWARRAARRRLRRSGEPRGRMEKGWQAKEGCRGLEASGLPRQGRASIGSACAWWSGCT
jgi:hypothetical protein